MRACDVDFQVVSAVVYQQISQSKYHPHQSLNQQ